MGTMVDLFVVTSDRGKIAPAFRIGQHRRVLETINEPLVTGAAWRRRLPTAVYAWLKAQERSGFLEVGIVARPKVLLDELYQAADAIGVPPSLGRRAFLGDVAELARTVADVADVPNVDVRLSIATVAALDAEYLVRDGLRLLAVYHIGAAPHLQCATRTKVEGWQLVSSGTFVHLECTSVLMLKGRQQPARDDLATLQWIARGTGLPSHGAVYLLEIRP